MSNISVNKALLEAKAKNISPLDAELLLAHVLDTTRTKIIGWPEAVLKNEQAEQYDHLISKRAQHIPIAYLLGEKEFWSLPLCVSADVLTPRPDTECLVEQALRHIPESKACEVLDLATGSGAIACALASERPEIAITATDISLPALLIAKKNMSKLKLENIFLVESNWFENLSGKTFDFIISNPPYLAENDSHLEKELLFEPRQALVSGKTGLEAFEIIVSQAVNYLKPGAMLLLEHGCDQAESLQALFAKQGFTDIETIKDTAGLPRITFARMHNDGNGPT